MNKEQIKTVVQVGTLFVAPVALIYFNIIPVEYRFYVILSGMLLILAIIFLEKMSLKELGIRTDNIKKSALPYLALTVLAIVATLLLARLLGHKTAIISESNHFLYGFIVLSFFQEFLFRSFLMPKLKLIFSSPIIVISINALLFGYLHIIYPDTGLLFLLSTALGVGFATVYYYRPNLILATIAHSAINWIAVYYCFATLTGSCMAS
jgi:membrane protease YdiL (CAAX protease family)